MLRTWAPPFEPSASLSAFHNLSQLQPLPSSASVLSVFQSSPFKGWALLLSCYIWFSVSSSDFKLFYHASLKKRFFFIEFIWILGSIPPQPWHRMRKPLAIVFLSFSDTNALLFQSYRNNLYKMSLFSFYFSFFNLLFLGQNTKTGKCRVFPPPSNPQSNCLFSW